jgi:hypothetical protein
VLVVYRKYLKHPHLGTLPQGELGTVAEDVSGLIFPVLAELYNLPSSGGIGVERNFLTSSLDVLSVRSEVCIA